MHKKVKVGVVGKTRKAKTKARNENRKSILSSSIMRLSGFHLCQLSSAKSEQLLGSKAR